MGNEMWDALFSTLILFAIAGWVGISVLDWLIDFLWRR